MPPFGVVLGSYRPAQAAVTAMEAVRSPRRAQPEPTRAAVGRLMAADARVEDLEHWLDDVLQKLARVDAKRGLLQGQIAAASRGRRRAAPARRAAAAGGAHAPPPLLLPAPDKQHGGACGYTRKGAGAVRKRLRAAAGDVKRERERLEAELGDLEEALADARERLALRREGRAA